MPASTARTALAGAALGVLIALATAAPAHAQSTVTVRSGQHDGYARLVFDWSKPVRFEASLDGNQLIVRFEAPLSADLGAAAIRRLDGYVTRPVLAPDRRSVTFDLVRPVTVRSFQNERSTVIDLVDQRGAAAPVAPARAAASEAPAPAPAATPSQPAPVRAEAPAASPPAAPAPSPIEPRALAALPVRVGEHDDFTRLKFEWPQSVEYKVEASAGRAKIQFDRPVQIDLAALKSALPRAVAQPELIDNGIVFNIPRTAQVRHFRSGLAVVVDVLAPPATAALDEPAPAPAALPAPVTAAPPPAVAREPERSPLSIAAQAAPAAAQTPDVRPPAIQPVEQQGPTVPVTVAGPRIRIAWKQPPSAAVFARGSSVYVLFDKPAKFDLAAFAPNPRIKQPVERMAAPEIVQVNGGSGLRFTVAANLNPQPLRENDAWTITLRNEPRRPQSVAAVTIESATAEGPRVAVAMTGAESMLTLTDPERGEPMRVVPVRTSGLGVDSGRQFAQFDILPSNQGLVVVTRADGIDVRQVANNILVGASQGALVLSRTPSAGAATAGVGGIFDFARWNESDVDFTETRQGLSRAVADADPARRAAARFELAQFFLARNHAADAVGELNLIAGDGGRYATDPSIKALRGAARVMLQDGAAAKAELFDPQLNNDTAVLVWRAGAAALRGEWAEADQLFRRGGRLPVSYPPALRQRLLLLAAEAALNAGDSGRVRELLDGLSRGDVPAHVRAQADYLRARALIASDDRKGALPLLQRLAAANDQWSRAHGEFLLVDQQLADNTIAPPEAIERLDRVRFVWSGDALEYRLLRRLGELQVEHGDVRAGLNRLREAVAHFPDNPDNGAIRARMTDAFEGLYDGSAPRKLAPLTALSLYDDFRDLTPPGPRGDRMIQNLADRLVAMDLLDRAGELLEYQIKNRLTGAEKARIGARLAVIQLLDRKPQAASAALDETEVPKLPPELAAERRHLKARAVSETGDNKAALALLEGDTDRDADQLRAEIQVRSQNWSMAAQALDRLVGDPGQGVFDAARRRQILNLAIAYALAGDAEGLRSVRDRFGDKMTTGATKDAFGLVTSVTEGGAVSDKALSSRFAELQEFQQFMASYREKLKSSSLSAIN
ncbi:MAG: hypothetical protein HY060_26070 [Proteobacteria bacterium]|nr:hypothetical protein [Pseudomonadota bacterium]